MKVETDADVGKVEKYIAAASKSTEGDLEPCKEGEAWSVADTSSSVTMANCKKTIPNHEIRPSKGSRKGLTYMAASGGRIRNEGQVTITHHVRKVLS